MQKIMFNDQYRLNKAVLEGWKTNTRRIIPQSVIDKAEDYRVEYHNATLDGVTLEEALVDLYKYMGTPCLSRYKVGEEVAIAQSYRDVSKEVFLFSTKVRGKEYRKGWGNKMFVRANLMPHKIKITNVRVERLQDISDEDCLKEGIEFARGGYYTNYNKETNSRTWLGNTPKEAFATLIDKVLGKGTWESNPLVFVYEFELVK